MLGNCIYVNFVAHETNAHSSCDPAFRRAARGIQVHEIRPGFIRTDMTTVAGSEVIAQWIRQDRVPMSHWGTPQDVGDAVAVLASGKMPYTIGQPFWVAGGLNIAQPT